MGERLVQIGVIVVAAGRGRRMGADRNKVLLPLRHQPILMYTLERLLKTPNLLEVVVVYHPDDQTEIETIIRDMGSNIPIQLVSGGEERQDSVYQGLKKLSAQCDVVFIHDGARPFVSVETLQRLSMRMEEIQGAVLGVPVKDTIKEVNKAGVITGTLPRSSLYAIQTPQAFRRDLLLEAYEKAMERGFYATDDAALVEQLGVPVEIVMGEYTNIKVTTPDDLWYADRLIQQMQMREGN